jgi:pyrimidine-specific ribonucleoside hydrolase
MKRTIFTKRFVLVLTLCIMLAQCLISYVSAHEDPRLEPCAPVVMKKFPVDPALFKEDVRPYLKKIIERHGLEEWKACVLTNELHRHLGIYSLVGAKMGVRAREILAAPFDTVDVISLAGNQQPLSCMNDGLQVSTGASVGRAAITIAHVKQPAAIFLYNDRKVTLRMKKGIVNQIEADIGAAIKKYGGLNPEYFAHIRKLSLEYWLTLDRKEIFEEIVE